MNFDDFIKDARAELRSIKSDAEERAQDRDDIQSAERSMNLLKKIKQYEERNTIPNQKRFTRLEKDVEKQIRETLKYTLGLAGQVKQKENITLNDIKKGREKNTPQDKIIRLLSKEDLSSQELARLIKKKKVVVEYIITELQDQGYKIIESDGLYKLNKSILPQGGKISIPYYENTYRFGIVTDTHSGSTHEQLTHLHTMYDIFEGLNVNHVYHAGDITAGIKMYRGQEYEAHKYGADVQREWAVKTYPKRKGITTIIIAGNHDGSYMKESGYDITEGICKQRDDFQYIGFMEGNIELENGLKIEMLHPDGGVPYAKSYRSQKINEARGRGPDVPHIAIYGHMHVAIFHPYLGIYDIDGGCFEGQTTYEKRKGLNPQIGGWIIEVNMKDNEINRIRQEWIPFKEIMDDYKNF